MFCKWLGELFDEVSDLYCYFKMNEVERELQRLDKCERIIRRLRRELLSRAYAQFACKHKT